MSGVSEMTVSLLVQPRLSPLRSSAAAPAAWRCLPRCARASSRVWLTDRPLGDDSIAVGYLP